MEMTVKAARVNSGKTQIEVAQELGMSLVAYVRKENGHTRFYADEIFQLARIFKMKADNFFEVRCRKKTQNKIRKGA